MIGAISSVLLGALTFVFQLPVVLPVFGLALGINSLIKQRRLPNRQRAVLATGVVGSVISGAAVLLILAGLY